MSRDESLPSYPFPFIEQLEPKPEYARRRRECPFGRVKLPTGDSAILLVRHADVAAAAAEPKLSRNHVMPGAPRDSNDPNFLYDATLIMNQAETTHDMLHQIATQALTPRRVGFHRPVIKKIAQGLVAEMARHESRADLIASYTDRLPLLTITSLLGIPRHECPKIRRWSAAYTLSMPFSPNERAGMVKEFSSYIREFTANPRDVPDSPLLQDLAFSADGSPAVSHTELANLVRLIVSAGGTEAPSAIMGRSMLYLLLEAGDLWSRMVRDPSCTGSVVDELLRLVYVGDGGALRTAIADVELPSGRVHAGDAVLLSWFSALHDPERYDDPNAFRLGRAGRNIGFGGGRSYCPGAHLARAVLETGIGTLAEQLADLHVVVPREAIPLVENPMGTIVRSLPVAW